MVDFSFTWLSVEPSRCPSNTSEREQMQSVRSSGDVRDRRTSERVL